MLNLLIHLNFGEQRFLLHKRRTSGDDTVEKQIQIVFLSQDPFLIHNIEFCQLLQINMVAHILCTEYPSIYISVFF